MSTINGDNILYHYIQKHLFDNPEIAQEVIENFIINLSIWLPVSFYQELPIVLPYVIRDPTCRKRSDRESEEWGTANGHGYLRDDNSLIKGLPKSFAIKSRKIKEYNRQKIGNGFTASHIWRVLHVSTGLFLSNRHHIYNSFVPNIVWLPRQIAKLSDRDNSIAQRMLQAISVSLYRDIDMPQEISNLWALLPMPEEYEDIDIDINQLTFFQYNDSWMKKRKKQLKNEINTILSIDVTQAAPAMKVKCSRYLPTLVRVPRENREELNDYLIRYRDVILK